MIGITAAKKVMSYLEAKWSGESLPDTQMERLATCFSCDWLIIEKRNDSGALDFNGVPVENPYYYCKKCGCPRTKYWPDSELRKKVTFAKDTCPLKKWVR